MREGVDVAGEVADLAGDVGEWGGRERERGIQIPHHLRARARGRCGGGGRAATWARGVGAEGRRDVERRRRETAAAWRFRRLRRLELRLQRPEVGDDR